MAAIAPIQTSNIVDPQFYSNSASIACDRTFAPEGFNPPGVARYVDRSTGVALLYPSFSLSIRPPTKASRLYKVTAKVSLPTPDITAPTTSTGIQPAPSKAYDCSCIIEFLLPERSALLERSNLFSTVTSLFASSIKAVDSDPIVVTGSPLKAMVETFESVY
jgi:hypothetical protein